MPPKPWGTVPIAPGTSEQTQDRRTSILGSGASPCRPIELPARVRTSHACDRCRELRAKCSGGVRCAKCTKDDASGTYSDRKRERNKKYAIAESGVDSGKQLTDTRSLVRNVAQIDELQSDRRALISALRSVAEAQDFEAENHPDLLHLLDKLSIHEAYPRAVLTPQMSEVREKSQSASVVPSTQTQSSQSEGSNPFDTSPMISSATSAGPAGGGEGRLGSGIGSRDRQREMSSAVDLDFGTGMPGYVGQMGNVAWLQRVRAYLVGIKPSTVPDLGQTEMDEQSLQALSLSYWTDDENLLAIDEDYVDAYQLPRWTTALILTEAFFSSIQGAFRFVQRQQFLQDLRELYGTASGLVMPSWRQRGFLALANVMWAVAAKWLKVTQLDQRPIPGSGGALVSEGHLTYYSRARALGLDHRMQVDHPSLETIQGMSVLGFYLMVNGSIHRAWGLNAQTIRHATALGLHLRFTSGSLPEDEVVRRSRLWWSLYRMEVLLSEVTGRPKCLHAADFTVPFRKDEGQVAATGTISITAPVPGIDSLTSWNQFLGPEIRIANRFSGSAVPWADLGPTSLNISEAHFVAALELSGLSERIGSNLYLRPPDLAWAGVQATVRGLEHGLERWRDELDANHRMESINKSSTDPRSILELEMYCCSLQMILFQPFLCELQIEEESSESMDVNKDAARACVFAAMRMVEVLPDDPSAHEVLQVLPWWALLHYISQVTAVLLLEMCLNIQHMQNETNDVLASLRKALHYLWALAPVSKSAFRAWNIFRPLVEKVSQRFRRNVLADVPLEAQRPRAWSEHDEDLLRRSVAGLAQ